LIQAVGASAQCRVRTDHVCTEYHIPLMMSPFAITLSTCFFFIGSLAASCIDDEVAMFQGNVRLRSHHDDETTSLSDGELEQLTGFKTYLSSLESKPPLMQAPILTKWANYLPTIQAWDKTVLEFTANMSSQGQEIEDWVQATYAGSGTNVAGLHKAADFMDVVSQLPLDKFGLGKMGEMLQATSTLLGNADKFVNGLDQYSNNNKAKKANTTLTWMDQSIEQLQGSNALFLEEVELMEEAVTRMVKKTILIPGYVKTNLLKVPHAAQQLREHTLLALKSVKLPFEQAFNSLDTVKDIMSKEQAEEAVHDIYVGFDVAKEMSERFQQHQDLVIAARNASQDDDAARTREDQAEDALQVATSALWTALPDAQADLKLKQDAFEHIHQKAMEVLTKTEKPAKDAVEAAQAHVKNALPDAQADLKQKQDDLDLAHQHAIEVAAAKEEAEKLLEADNERLQNERKEMAAQNKTFLDTFNELFEEMKNGPSTAEEHPVPPPAEQGGAQEKPSAPQRKRLAKQRATENQTQAEEDVLGDDEETQPETQPQVQPQPQPQPPVQPHVQPQPQVQPPPQPHVGHSHVKPVVQPQPPPPPHLGHIRHLR